jgi:hypothetical protein
MPLYPAIDLFFSLFIYSYVHTLFGPFLPLLPTSSFSPWFRWVLKNYLPGLALIHNLSSLSPLLARIIGMKHRCLV